MKHGKIRHRSRKRKMQVWQVLQVDHHLEAVAVAFAIAIAAAAAAAEAVEVVSGLASRWDF